MFSPSGTEGAPPSFSEPRSREAIAIAALNSCFKSVLWFRIRIWWTPYRNFSASSDLDLTFMGKNILTILHIFLQNGPYSSLLTYLPYFFRKSLKFFKFLQQSHYVHLKFANYLAGTTKQYDPDPQQYFKYPKKWSRNNNCLKQHVTTTSTCGLSHPSCLPPPMSLPGPHPLSPVLLSIIIIILPI